MPYGLIFPIATIALVLRYIIATDASSRAKYIVGGIAGASFVIPSLFPYGPYVAMALQLGVCVFVILYLTAVTPEK